MSAPTTPFGKTPTQIPNYRDDFYIPRRSRVPSTVGLGVSVTVAVCCALVILGSPTILVVLAAVAGALVGAAATIITRRHWLETQVRPAAMRQAVATALGQPLPERLQHQSRRTLTAGRYQFGTLTMPGPARRIVLTGRHLAMLDAARLETITAVLSRLEGIQYTVGTKKNKPGRYVFTPKPIEKIVKLTPREQIEKRLAEAAKDVFGAGARTTCTWNEATDDTRAVTSGATNGTRQATSEDYLLAVDITGIKGIDYALSGKQNQAGARLLSQLKEKDFTYAACPHEDRFSLFRSPPLPVITMPPARTAPMLVDHKAYHRFEVPLGIGPHGTQALWHPAGANGDPHLLIIGGTGGGKTISLHGVIQAATQAAWRVWLVDGKRIEFIGYKDWRNVEFLAQDVDAQIRLIHLAYETMNTRYDLIQAGKVRTDELDPIMLVIDEVTSMLISVANRYAETKIKGMSTKHPVMVWLGDIARLGRSAKIHMVFGMQRPDATIFDSGEIRDNFSGRISLGKLQSAQGSNMMWGNHAIGCQVPDIKGRAIGRINGQPTMIQATYNANPDPAHDDHHPGVIAAMTPPIEIYTRKRIKAPVPIFVGEDNPPVITWESLLDAEIIDSEGHKVIFDPVASEESRRFRAQIHPSTYRTAPRLQAAASREAGLALFPTPAPETGPRPGPEAKQETAGLAFGVSVANILARTYPAHQDTEPTTGQHDPGTPGIPQEHAPIRPNSSSNTPEVMVKSGLMFETTVEELETGLYATFEEIGAELMIAEIYPDDDCYFIVGVDDDGHEVTVEVPADTVIQARVPDEDDT